MAANPADGERRAMAGYVPQYTLGAALILKALVQRRLEWIKIADPDAGRVDDFQLGTHNRVDAFQVKWSTYSGAITWSDLARESDGKPSLIRQLAEGWQRLRIQRPGCRVVVHLVTNDFASSNDNLPVDFSGGTRRHLAAFLAQAWNPWRADLDAPLDSLEAGWQYTMGQLQAESGLSDAEFRQFASDCELDLASSLPLVDPLQVQDETTVRRDVEHIRSRLFEAIRSPQRIVELGLDELLQTLGWTEHFYLRRKHEFPVENDLYRPIEDTVAAVNAAIDRLPSGYLAVLGSPGSGKSTLLTHLLRYRAERVVKYYAYIPKTGEPLEIRGESTSFLHDLVCQISEAGFRGGEGAVSPLDRQGLQAVLHRQMQAIATDFGNHGRKTVVLVDGLDHVPREYHPDRSFLHDLPLPSQIPEGVLFVLGSQTDELEDLPREVRDSVQTADRRIEVGRLGRPAVHDIVSRALPSRKITGEQEDLIFQLCEGHPLALRYLLNLLADSDDIDVGLKTAAKYKVGVPASYSAYWSALRDEDPQVVDILALMCRMRAPIDMGWVATWADGNVLRRLRQEAGHYFQRENETRWTFFHNSFRVYVEAETAKSAVGAYDEVQDRSYHGRIAEHLRVNGREARHRLEELYHRTRQGDGRTVLQIATQSFFRQAAYTGTPVDRVIRSIHWALEAAAKEQDPLAMVRLALALKEAQQRYEEQDEETNIDLLIGLGEYESAIELLRDGQKLIAAPSVALKASLALLAAGRVADATALFDLAEPSDILGKRVHVDQSPALYDRDALNNWAAAAVHFRGTAAVVSLIAELDSEPLPVLLKTSKEEFLAEVRNRMRLEAGIELLEGEKWPEFCTVRATLNPANPLDQPYWLRLTLDAVGHAREAGNAETLKAELGRLGQTVTPPQCDADDRAEIAVCIYRIGGDADSARQWIAGLPQPDLQKGLYGAEVKDLSLWRQRIRLNSLLCALIDNHPRPRELIPDVPESGRNGMVLFERALCHLAQLRGRRWRGRPLASVDVAQETLGLVRLFYRDWQETRDWHDWNSALSARAAFYEELTAEISMHGLGCLEKLMAVLDAEWAGPHAPKWPIDVKRKVILEAMRRGMARSWGVQHLAALDEQAEGLDISSRVWHHARQGKAWLDVGESERVRNSLEQMRKSAVGVGYRKDYQSSAWIRHLGEYLDKRPEESRRLIPWMARAMVTLEHSTDQGAREAAQELVEVAFRQSPRNAVRLTQWFCGRGVRWWHQTGLKSLICAASTSSLDRPELLIAAAVDLFLPLATYVTSEQVPERLGNYILAHLPKDAALAALDDVILVCDTLALATSREGWRHGLDSALKKRGLPERYSNDNAEEAMASSDAPSPVPPPSLRLKTGEELTENDVRQRCSTFAGLIETLRAATDEHYGYNWDSRVRPLLGGLGRQQLFALIEPLRAKGRTELLLEVGERLHDLGDVATARLLAEEVLEDPYQFSTELRDEPNAKGATALLRRIDPGYAKRKAYETIARELVDKNYAAHEITTKIPAVLRLLGEEVAPEVLWPEIEDHLRALFDERDVASVPPPEWQTPVLDDRAGQALVDLLVAHAVHPCTEVRLAAMRGLARAARAGCTEAIAAIARGLAGSACEQWHMIRLAEALAVEDPSLVIPLQAEITKLGACSNYAVRQMALAICARLDWTPSEASPRSELPAVYRLWLPEDKSGAFLLDRPPAVGEVCPDTAIPAVMVRPYHLEAEFLAKAVKLEPGAVLSRTAALMRQIEPFEKWSAEAEKQQLDELKTVGPEFPYNRPRAAVARRAIFHVAAELVDGGLLPEAQAQWFFSHVRPHDPEFLLQCGASRPSQLVRPPEREYPKTTEAWRKEGDVGQCLSELGEAIVLAEDTHFKSLGDDHLKERRQTVVLPKEWVDQSANATVDLWGRLHEVVIGGTFEDCVFRDDLPRDLVIAHRLDGCDSPGSEWLAANPAMAGHMGWQSEDGKWFIWRDAEGQIAVRSLWWQDGLLDHISRNRQCWVGEGWCVLASQNAIKRIESEVGPLCRVSCVTRGVEHDDRGWTKTKVDPLNAK